MGDARLWAYADIIRAGRLARYRREKARRRRARYGAFLGRHSSSAVSTSNLKKSEVREFKRLLAETRRRNYRNNGSGNGSSGGFGSNIGSGGLDFLIIMKGMGTKENPHYLEVG